MVPFSLPSLVGQAANYQQLSKPLTTVKSHAVNIDIKCVPSKSRQKPSRAIQNAKNCRELSGTDTKHQKAQKASENHEYPFTTVEVLRTAAHPIMAQPFSYRRESCTIAS